MVTDNEEAKVIYERLDAAFRETVTEVTNLRADLGQAEKDAEENRTNWRNWYEDLSEGVDESRSSIQLWGHLCDMLSRTYVASHIPGMAVKDAEIAEAAKNKKLLLEEETECAQLRKSMTENNPLNINLQSAFRKTIDELTQLRSKVAESPSNQTDGCRDNDNAGRSSSGSPTDHYRPRHNENTEATDQRPFKHSPFTGRTDGPNITSKGGGASITENTSSPNDTDDKILSRPLWKQSAQFCVTRCRSTGLLLKMSLVVKGTTLKEMSGRNHSEGARVLSTDKRFYREYTLRSIEPMVQ